MDKATTLFIVEGARREVRFLKSLRQEYMPQSRAVEILILPAEQDIYMLYQKLSEDDFETDIVEVLRESSGKAQEELAGLHRNDVDEIFLFFDFDPQRFKKMGAGGAVSQIAATMDKMLEAFDNETEAGKLYVSYPMIEALYDYREGEMPCTAHSECYLPFASLADYKRLAGDNNPNTSRHPIPWKEILNIFIAKASCLLDLEDICFDDFREHVTPLSIYSMQRQLLDQWEGVFSLSALPEFVLDYFVEDFWDENIVASSIDYKQCRKRKLPDEVT